VYYETASTLIFLTLPIVVSLEPQVITPVEVFNDAPSADPE
jgi:hypothetical protein